LMGRNFPFREPLLKQRSCCPRRQTLRQQPPGAELFHTSPLASPLLHSDIFCCCQDKYIDSFIIGGNLTVLSLINILLIKVDNSISLLPITAYENLLVSSFETVKSPSHEAMALFATFAPSTFQEFCSAFLPFFSTFRLWIGSAGYRPRRRRGRRQDSANS